MATIKARTAALAAVVTGGMLCEALSCAPARADDYAFGGVTSDAELTLTLTNGSIDEIIEIAADLQGDAATGTGIVIAVPSTANTPLLAGVKGGANFDNYFQFILPSEPTGFTVESATLTLESGMIISPSPLAYTLFGPEKLLSFPTTGQQTSPYSGLSGELGTGMPYATYIVSPNSMSEIVIALDGAAISALIQAAPGAKFQITGSVAAVPEPSTWIMILAGFAGLGVAGWRREARRRAAASAG
jgi:PEP-CTERM motif-containing protein